MRLIYLLTTTLCLGAQSVPSAKFDDTQYRKALGLDSHIHMPGNCKGAPDGVYMRSGQSYYACISGRNVCNRDPAEIPDRLMRAFDASRAQFDARASQLKANAPTVRHLTPVGSGIVAAAAPSPAIVKLADEKASAVAVGHTRSQVLEALGKPHSRVSGDYEKFSYRLQSGKTLSLEFEGGQVSKVRTVTPN